MDIKLTHLHKKENESKEKLNDMYSNHRNLLILPYKTHYTKILLRAKLTAMDKIELATRIYIKSIQIRNSTMPLTNCISPQPCISLRDSMREVYTINAIVLTS